MSERKKKLANWGNYPAVDAIIQNFEKPETVVSLLSEGHSRTLRGSGLSYGDASLSDSILSTLQFNKILNLDSQGGIIKVEAGITLDEVLRAIVPEGWFLPVTPGTKFITVGGAVAGDVHGKNHHSEGAFGRYVLQLEVMMANGEIKTCGPEQNPDLFKLICGGLGHAALILHITFRLKPIKTAFIRQRNVIVKNLDEMLANLQNFNSATYSVSWIDCLASGNNLGRGVIMLGEHAQPHEVSAKEPLRLHTQPKLSAPFFFPAFLLNSFSVRAFNLLYFNKFRLAQKEAIVHYDPYFYPLDFVRNWNKLYGRRGFLQYQFVIPFDQASKGLRIILQKISQSGMASFLAVLKALGEGENLMSFPMPGFTLALDFPVSHKVFPMLDELDKIVVNLGGRIYLVKDARMQPEIYWQGYPNAGQFKAAVNQLDPQHQFVSALSKRLKML